MKKIMKLLSLILCGVLILTTFASCVDEKNDETDDVVMKAGSLLDRVKITTTTVKKLDDFIITVEGVSAAEKEALESIYKQSYNQTSESVTYYDGNNYVAFEEDGNTTVFENVLYLESSGLKYKMDFSADGIVNAADFITDELDFQTGLETFESYEITENADGSVTIKASGNKNAGYVSDLLDSADNLSVGTAAEYVIEIDSDGRFSSIYTKAVVVVALMELGQGYYIKTTTEDTSVFDYSDVIQVTAPADADEYEKISEEDLW